MHKFNLPIIFFLLLVFVGLIIFRGYGIGWDEFEHRNMAAISIRYIGNLFHIDWIRFDPVLSIEHLYWPTLGPVLGGGYGVIFEVSALVLERLLSIGEGGNSHHIYYLRHLLVFFVSVLGVVAVYQMAQRRFGDWRIGMLAALFMVLSPRIFAESFYNSKDIVFMALFAVSMNTAINFILHPNLKNAFFHGLATALAIDIRIMGIVMIPVTIASLILRVLRRESPLPKTIFCLLVYLFCSLAITIVFWPWLWEDPFGRLIGSFIGLSKFAWKGVNLYLGQFIPGTQIPWHYPLVWIGITTPLIYLALFVVGVGATIHSSLQRKWRLWSGDQQFQDLFFLGLFVSPILAVIVLHSVLYDGWRQLYFVYPAFILLAVKGAVILWGFKFRNQTLANKAKLAMTIVLSLALVWTAIWMVRAHPHQNVYFNALVGKNWKSKFDVDYWGLSNRSALEVVLKDTSESHIRIFTPSFPNVGLSFPILSPEKRRRFHEVDLPQDADYIITHFRTNLDDYSTNLDYRKVKDIRIGGEIINSIYSSNKNSLGTKPPERNTPFAFSKNGSGVNYLLGIGAQEIIGSGWSYPEAWGTWSDGNLVKILIPLNEGNFKELSLEVLPFIPFSGAVIEFDVFINRKFITSVVFKEGKLQNISFPIDSLIENFLEVELKFKKTYVPNQYDKSEDRRHLALGLVSGIIK